jgi:hypothetical protein
MVVVLAAILKCCHFPTTYHTKIAVVDSKHNVINLILGLNDSLSQDKDFDIKFVKIESNLVVTRSP